MSTTEELKAQGYLEYRELIELVAAARHVSELTYRKWLATPLTKLRALLIDHDHVILPEDREWNCLYSPDLVPFLISYVARHQSFSRNSVASCVQFYKDFVSGDRKARSYLPPEMRRKRNRLAQQEVTNLADRRRRRQAG